MGDVFKKIKNKLGKNGSPIVAMLLVFAVSFGITVFAFKSCTVVEVDHYKRGQRVREIIDGELGEVVATINGVDYYERDLQLALEGYKVSDPNIVTLKEEQLRAMAGEQLVKEKMFLQEFDRLNLTITEEEFLQYVAQKKQETDNTVLAGGTAADAINEYISGYGCTYSEYWNDEYLLSSLRDELKIDKIMSHLQIESNISGTLSTNEHLTKLLRDGVYKVTLFGNEFK